MNVSEHIAALQTNGELLAAAATTAGLDAKVPSCPDWVVRDLVRHTGGVHRWAASIVTGSRAEPWKADMEDIVGNWPADAELVEWFLAGHAAIVAALAYADPNLECWTFLPAPSPLAFWARRQAHETAMHRVDAELATARPLTPFAPAFAADGIDELLRCFITRRNSELRADPPQSLQVSCTDASGEWLVSIESERVKTTVGNHDADCTVRGDASDLYRALWNRQSPTPLTIDGDNGLLDLFLDRVQVRWT